VKEDFLNYLHNFRGFAIILIVGVHCRTTLPWAENSIVQKLLLYGLDFSTILFVFISGFLFQYINAEKFDYARYLTKKIQYVILPYILVSIPALVDKLFIETDAYWMTDFYKSLNIFAKIIYMLLTGKHSGPFYFIPVITVIFLLAPVFNYLQKLKIFHGIAFVIVAAGMFSYNYGYYATFLESLIYFIPVYVFGIWACKNRTYILTLKSYWILALLVIYITIFTLEMTQVITVDRMKFFGSVQYFSLPFNWGKFKVMILAIILLYTFYKLNDYKLPLLKTLGNYSFGIYFIHIYFINTVVLALHHFNISFEQNLLIYLTYLTLIMGASMGVVYIVKIIFGKQSRLIIGS
jgi:fucose 4-O-acetylase-like acetyltransferase